MQATHYTFTSEHQAQAAYHRFAKRGWTTSNPWQDQLGTWRVTVLHYGT